MNKLARVVVEEPNSDSVQDRDAGNVEQYLKKKIEAEIRMKLINLPEKYYTLGRNEKSAGLLTRYETSTE